SIDLFLLHLASKHVGIADLIEGGGNGGWHGVWRRWIRSGIEVSSQCALINKGNLTEMSGCKQANNPLSVSKRVSDVC
ncbi:hypothetical protein ACWTQY_32420, partial [Klebsiella pneumoniae]